MTRVSLREAYDNKDVIAQIYAIRDTAESAVDTSEQAVTTANTASDHVDALVPQVEGAVQNANSASASAQASAQTVAGYENRLGAVETGLGQTESDLNAVTLRVTTAEGDIVTIQGRVTALETADGQNVKLTGGHAIGNYAVLLTGNQPQIAGVKGFATLPSISSRVRLAGASKIEIFRTPVTDGNTVVNLLVATRSSSCVVLGSVTVTIANGEITGVGKDFISNKTSNISRIYAHIEGDQLVFSIGNSSTFNNNYSVTILSVYTGAGDVKIPDFTYLNRTTSVLVDETNSVAVCQ